MKKMLLRITIDLLFYVLLALIVNLYIGSTTMELFSLKLPCLTGDADCLRRQHDEQLASALKLLPIFIAEIGITFLVDRFIVRKLIK